jgi:hypothetical protein
VAKRADILQVVLWSAELYFRHTTISSAAPCVVIVASMLTLSTVTYRQAIGKGNAYGPAFNGKQA